MLVIMEKSLLCPVLGLSAVTNAGRHSQADNSTARFPVPCCFCATSTDTTFRILSICNNNRRDYIQLTALV